VLTFRLGARELLPPHKVALRTLEPPADKPTKEVFERGLYLYQVNCMICHGDTGVSGGVVPDLRYSEALGAPDAWKSIVVDGTRVNNGMVPFANILKADEVETIRAYVIQRAHDEKARLAAQ
jgi:quinohemoprotein ethanol dehydrogenase